MGQGWIWTQAEAVFDSLSSFSPSAAVPAGRARCDAQVGAASLGPPSLRAPSRLGLPHPRPHLAQGSPCLPLLSPPVPVGPPCVTEPPR